MQTFGARRRATTSLISLVAGGLLIAGCTSTGVIRSATPSSGTSGSSSSAAPGTPTDSPSGSASPGDAAAGLQSFYAQKITWGACTTPPAEAPSTDLTPFQCGTLKVPLDYTKPTGDSIGIAVVRWAAASASTKQGSLLTNPGGPGASGVNFVEEAKQQFDGTLHAHFDIIGFDPRGLGRSQPIQCLSDRQQDVLNQVDAPKDAAARKAKADKDARDFAAACVANSGKMLPFIGTRNVARDMDILRQVLGDKKLNYLGISYGTYLGSLYAEQFPKNVGRVILDGAVDPNADELDSQVKQQIGFENSLENFVADCIANHAADCPLSGDPKVAATKLGAFLDGLRDHPLPTRDPGGRKLDSTLGWTGMIIGLYGDAASGWWDYLRQGLTAAMTAHDGSILLSGSDQYNGRDKSGHYSTEQDGLVAVRCADFPHPAPNPTEVQKVYDELKQGAPILNTDLSKDDLSAPGCIGWPFQTTGTPHVVKADGSDPILVVGTTDDPATPYQNAVNLAKGFANARLLTRVGQGHAAFGAGNVCIDQAMGAYLVSGTLPADGTRCTK